MSEPSWGVVSTIKAPATDVLNFVAHHLDLGAHRVCIYLDEANPAAFAALKAHPKCRVIVTDDAYWQRRKGRPGKHQARQTANATHCYRRRADVDWLLHIDADEFLWPQSPLSGQLSAIPPDRLSARVRPIEALAADPAHPPPGGQTWFKGCTRMRLLRAAQTDLIYPTYGPHLNGGFLSHVAGKVFVRTGRDKISLRIHNAFVAGKIDDKPQDLNGSLLCHLHAPSWDAFRAAYRFRLARGSYRSDLKPVPLAGEAGMNMHALFSMLEAEGGEDALRAFYTEVCTATPELRDRLMEHKLLHGITLELEAKRARHFPDFA